MDATLEAEAATELSEEMTEETEAPAEEETDPTTVLFPPTVPFPRGAPPTTGAGVGVAEAKIQKKISSTSASPEDTIIRNSLELEVPVAEVSEREPQAAPSWA